MLDPTIRRGTGRTPARHHNGRAMAWTSRICIGCGRLSRDPVCGDCAHTGRRYGARLLRPGERCHCGAIAA